MGFLNFPKNLEDLKRKDFEARARGFIEEYRQLVRKWKCDWQAKLDFLDGGNGGIVPKMQLRDATKEVEAELKAEAEVEKKV